MMGEIFVGPKKRTSVGLSVFISWHWVSWFARACARGLMLFLGAPARKSVIKVNQNNEYFPLSIWDYQIVEIIAA
jgi:hypothetical protein